MRQRAPKRGRRGGPRFLPAPDELRLFRGLADAAVVSDRSGMIVGWNPAAERLFGYRAEQIVGAPADRLLPARLLASSRVALGPWRKYGPLGEMLGATPLDAAILAADGTEIDVEMTLSEVEAPGRGEIWLVALMRDVRARKRHERDVTSRVEIVEERAEALEELTTRLAEAEEMAAVGSWSWQIAEDRVEWSDSLYRIYGSSPEAFGHSLDAFMAFVHPDDLPATEALVERAFADHRGFAHECRIVRPDGGIRNIRAAGKVILDDRGLPVRMTGFCQDITELRGAIESIARRDAELAQAHALDRLKTDLLNAVSHELRTPLSAIVAYAEFLEDELAGPLTDGQRDFLHGLNAGAARLRAQIDDLLDFACLEAGAFALHLGLATIGDVLAHQEADLAAAARAGGLTLIVDDQPPRVVVRLDVKRVGQVLGNFVRNAIKFTPAGGTVAVRIRHEGDAVRVEVQDTGPGIARPDQARLFQRFSQLEDGRRRGGTGIGLALCKAIADAHAGSVGVSSAPGEGATFWLRLPVAGPPPG